MKFQVFEKGELVKKFDLYGAYLFGTDGIAVRRTKITFKNGIIDCQKQNNEAAGLALLWPIDGFGKVLLPTTCLPERETPYNLNVELARAKLMQIINKREDWSFFNNLEGLPDFSEEARDLFIQALQNISSPSMAAELADKALEKGTVFSEKLANDQAEVLFEARSRNRGFGRGCLGCRVDPERITDRKYLENLLSLFGFANIPVNWAEVEPQRGQYDFSAIDACMNVLSRKKVAICIGPVLRFSKENLPNWLLRSKAGFEKIRDTAYQFVSQMVARYASGIRAWRIISGMNAFNHFGFNFEQMLEMTRAANMAVKASSDRALKIIEVSNPWGEYYATHPNTIPPLVYVDMVVQSGISFDAFGLQMQFGKDQEGMHTRDMMHISSVLDYFALIGRPLYITDVEVPGSVNDGKFSSEAAGFWHGQWDRQQRQWIEWFYRIALSKPFVDAVIYSNLIDRAESTIVDSGLMTENLEPKESFRGLKKLHETIFNRQM